ncbi:Hsp20/alpha crystallin family protein [Verrucomicrobiaceae bacterium N1E253]|uniref:Hsp20/alpha crystallin family protein n=1 Tax=Oceaniferula marina TaxID=2748318 RepID=A0A851GFA7_9BACT|nr:Hsp20 family protein [Oceaniferula marina]NWK56438.1 Hsp20/alpha crystallin family protein [Oceaniferula marina]
MNMINHYPLNNGLLSDFDRMINRAFGAESNPCCDSDTSCSKSIESQSQDEDGWKLRLELPGFRKGEVKVSADEEYLTVRAETEDEARSFLTTQERRIRISEEVNTSGIQAKLEDGILFLEIPRRVKEKPVDIVIS